MTKNILVLIALIICYDLTYAETIECANPESSNITIDLKIYLVKEIDACRPSGYTNNDSATKSRCKQIDIEYIDNDIADKYNVFSGMSIPPCTIKLPNILRQAIFSYDQSTSCNEEDGNTTGKWCGASEPSKRKAIMFVFKWNKLHDLPITLRRTQNNTHNKIINENTWTSKGNNFQHWINHQRADALEPNNRIQWELIVKDENENYGTWKFKTW